MWRYLFKGPCYIWIQLQQGSLNNWSAHVWSYALDPGSRSPAHQPWAARRSIDPGLSPTRCSAGPVARAPAVPACHVAAPRVCWKTDLHVFVNTPRYQTHTCSWTSRSFRPSRVREHYAATVVSDPNMIANESTGTKLIVAHMYEGLLVYSP